MGNNFKATILLAVMTAFIVLVGQMMGGPGGMVIALFLAAGAGFAGNPKGLSGALAKLGAYSGRLPMDANPSTAHMFIVNPLSGRSLMNLFSTHPPGRKNKPSRMYPD